MDDMDDATSRFPIPQAEDWATPYAGLPAPPGHDAGLPAPPAFPLPPGAPQPRPRRRGVLIALVALAALVSAAIGLSGGALRPSDRGAAVSQDVPIVTPPTSVGPEAASVAGAVAPAIVNINTFRTTFNSTTSSLEPLGAGTGMILSPDGEVLTNNHVVAGASKIEVEVGGRTTTYTAKVLGVDPSEDVALIQLQNVSGLPSISIGDASTLNVGQDVIAIGNALGRGGSPSVTTGSIAGLHRSITARDPGGDSERLDDLIQSSAPIQPGDSGGALVNMSGQVIGMITAGAAGSDAQTQTPSRVGFAIPLSNAIGIVTEIRAGHGSDTILLGDRGYMGVSVDPSVDVATQAAAQGIGATSGAWVSGVQPDSPADSAGMVAPAVIQSVDGEAVSSVDDLGPLLHVHVPGDRVSVTWVDANGSHTTTMTLAAGPAV
jgi:S1-C subfamily serine protease